MVNIKNTFSRKVLNDLTENEQELENLEQQFASINNQI